MTYAELPYNFRAVIDFAKHQFHPVIDLPADYEVYDFTRGYDPARARASEYGVGKYAEKRVGMYTAEIFAGMRDIHVGLDIAAPVGTEVRAFFDGMIHMFAYNAASGDYGYTLITRHFIDGTDLYALHGHLSARSLEGKVRGAPFGAGQLIAWLGDRHENGGWNPHLHFQLSYECPSVCDMPGVVNEADREAALRKYPDPRLVLGALY